PKPGVAGFALESRLCEVLGDDDLISQQGMSVGQIEHGLMGQLFRVVVARSTLKNDLIFRVHNVEIADSAVRDPIDMTLDELGDFLMTLADFKSKSLGAECWHGHSMLPL